MKAFRAHALVSIGLSFGYGGTCGCASRGQVARRAEVWPARVVRPVAMTNFLQGIEEMKRPDGEAQALSSFRAAAAADPRLWEARFNAGLLLARGGDLKAAEGELRAAAEVSGAPRAVVALAEVQRRRGELRDAQRVLEDFLAKRPDALEARTLLSSILRDSGDVEGSIRKAREVLLRNPGEPRALSELALSHLAKGETEAAVLLIKQAQTNDPNAAVPRRAEAQVAFARGDDAAAVSELLAVSQADASDVSARVAVAAIYLRAGAYAKAEEQYRTVLKRAPNDVDSAVGLSAALRGSADPAHPRGYDEARQLLTSVLDRNPHHMAALFNLGVLYADFMRRPAEAKAMLVRFLQESPLGHPARAEAERKVSALSNASGPVQNASAAARGDTK